MKMNLTRTLNFGTSYQDSTGKLAAHEYKLHITVRGDLDEKTGIVVNIVHIDEVLRTVLEQVDGNFLNEEVPFFKERVASMENLLHFFWTQLKGKLLDANLHRICIQQTAFNSGEIMGDDDMSVYVTKIYHFSSAHRLHSTYLSDEQNVELFGKCTNFYGHGHNYKLEVVVKGQPDLVTGLITNYKKLDDTVQKNVIDLFDHRHMNQDLPMFQDRNPSSEMVLLTIWDLLKDEVENLYKLGLWETEKNYFEYFGPESE